MGAQLIIALCVSPFHAYWPIASVLTPLAGSSATIWPAGSMTNSFDHRAGHMVNIVVVGRTAGSIWYHLFGAK